MLASGLASTSVGCYAGAEIMAGVLRVRVPMLVRRAVTLGPALVGLATGVEPTWAPGPGQVIPVSFTHRTRPAKALGSSPGGAAHVKKKNTTRT